MELTMEKIEIRISPGKGRGVFALVPFKKNDIIEKFPAIKLTGVDESFVWSSSEIMKRYFFIDIENSCTCILLGFGSIYNHSKDPNCRVENENPYEFRMIANRDIEVGEELFHDYHEDTDGFPDEDHVSVIESCLREGSQTTIIK